MEKMKTKALNYFCGITLAILLLTGTVAAQLSRPLVPEAPKKAPATLEEVIAAAPFHFTADQVARMKRNNESGSLSNKADSEAAKGDWANALGDYRQALTLNPNAEAAAYGMAAYSLSINDTQAAIGYYRRAIYDYASIVPPALPRFHEINAFRLMEYAILLSQTGQQEEAILVYKHGAQLLNYIDGYPRLKMMLPDFGNATGQIAYTPQRLQALANIGWADDHITFDREAAKARLQEAVVLFPDSPIPYFYRGRYEATYSRNPGAAEADFAKATRLGKAVDVDAVAQERQFFGLSAPVSEPTSSQKPAVSP